MSSRSGRFQRGFFNVRGIPPSNIDRQDMRLAVTPEEKHAACVNREKLKEWQAKALAQGQLRGLSGKPLKDFMKKYIAEARKEAERVEFEEALLATYHKNKTARK